MKKRTLYWFLIVGLVIFTISAFFGLGGGAGASFNRSLLLSISDLWTEQGINYVTTFTETFGNAYIALSIILFIVYVLFRKRYGVAILGTISLTITTLSFMIFKAFFTLERPTTAVQR